MLGGPALTPPTKTLVKNQTSAFLFLLLKVSLIRLLFPGLALPCQVPDPHGNQHLCGAALQCRLPDRGHQEEPPVSGETPPHPLHQTELCPQQFHLGLVDRQSTVYL